MDYNNIEFQNQYDTSNKYIKIINEIITHIPAMTPTGYAIYTILLTHRNHINGKCYPSTETIATKLGITTRTVQRTIKHLEDHNYIRVHRSDPKRTKAGQIKSAVNHYELLPLDDVIQTTVVSPVAVAVEEPIITPPSVTPVVHPVVVPPTEPVVVQVPEKEEEEEDMKQYEIWEDVPEPKADDYFENILKEVKANTEYPRTVTQGTKKTKYLSPTMTVEYDSEFDWIFFK